LREIVPLNFWVGTIIFLIACGVTQYAGDE
jgi:hypothetical protein